MSMASPWVGCLTRKFAGDYKGYGEAMKTGNFTAYFEATTPGAIGDYSHCAADHHRVHQSRLSFPSGHSGLSFVAMSFMALMMYEWVSEFCAPALAKPQRNGTEYPSWHSGGGQAQALLASAEASAGAGGGAGAGSLSPRKTSLEMHYAQSKAVTTPLARRPWFRSIVYTLRVALAGGCLLVAALVATSRIINYWHNVRRCGVVLLAMLQS